MTIADWKKQLEKYFDTKVMSGQVNRLVRDITVRVDGKDLEIPSGSLFSFSETDIVSVARSIQHSEKYHIHLPSISLITVDEA